jgi:hypothetical protein
MNTELAQAEQVPELEYVAFKGAEIPKRTFFYERVDRQNMSGFMVAPDEPAEIVAFSELEAFNLKPTQWKQVGVGDGTAYAKSIQSCGVKARQRIPVEQAKKIMKDAFEAELAVARGHFEQPTRQTYFFMGASQGTQGGEELAKRMN